MSRVYRLCICDARYFGREGVRLGLGGRFSLVHHNGVEGGRKGETGKRVLKNRVHMLGQRQCTREKIPCRSLSGRSANDRRGAAAAGHHSSAGSSWGCLRRKALARVPHSCTSMLQVVVINLFSGNAALPREPGGTHDLWCSGVTTYPRSMFSDNNFSRFSQLRGHEGHGIGRRILRWYRTIYEARTLS